MKRTLRHVTESTLRNAGKATVGVTRWAMTDHTGVSASLARMPGLGFFDTIRFLLLQFVFVIINAGSATFFL